MNARSLIKNKDEIIELVIKPKNPCIIALSETRLTNEIENCEISIPGYQIVRCHSVKRSMGGVMMYIKNGINFEIVVNEKIVKICWTVGIKMKYKDLNGVVMITYRSPKSSHSIFIDHIENICERMISQKCICVGDFNINVEDKKSFYANKLLQVLLGLGMKQYICESTRISETSSTTIDLIFSNYRIEAKVLDSPQITDHALIEFKLAIGNHNNNIKIMKRNLKTINSSRFKDNLKRECRDMKFDFDHLNHHKQIKNQAKLLIGKIDEIVDNEAKRE